MTTKSDWYWLAKFLIYEAVAMSAFLAGLIILFGAKP